MPLASPLSLFRSVPLSPVVPATSTVLHSVLEDFIAMATSAVMPREEKLFVGRETAAQLIDVSTRTIDEAIRAGELEAYRLGRRVLIPRAALIQFAERVSA